MTGESYIFLSNRQWASRGNVNLQRHQIQAGDLLSHGVLNLQARIHLHEEERRRVLRRHNELHRARADVADRAGRVTGRFTNCAARFLIQQRARCFLDDLLMASLQRALTLAQVDYIAVFICENLHLDMPRGVDEVLDEQGVIAEGTRRFTTGRRERSRQVSSVFHAVHPLAATACRRLNQYRKANRWGCLNEVLVAKPGARQTRHGGNIAGFDGSAGGDSVTHGVDGTGRWANEFNTCFLTGGREVCVFRQKAVTGVDSVCVAAASGIDNLVDNQVGLTCRRWANVDGHIRHADVRGVGIGIRVDRDGANSVVTKGSNNAAGNLPAVCDQYGTQAAASCVGLRVVRCHVPCVSFPENAVSRVFSWLLHAEDAEALFIQGRATCHIEGHAKNSAGICGIDDTVIPQASR